MIEKGILGKVKVKSTSKVILGDHQGQENNPVSTGRNRARSVDSTSPSISGVVKNHFFISYFWNNLTDNIGGRTSCHVIRQESPPHLAKGLELINRVLLATSNSNMITTQSRVFVLTCNAS